MATHSGKSAANVFSITCEGSYKTSELVAQGKYDWSDNRITDERFPIQPHAPVQRVIELIKFDHDPSSEEVLEEFERRGLERPTYEDALYFGIQHPDEQRKHHIVFLHEPVLGQYPILTLHETFQDHDSIRLVFVLREAPGRRYLELDPYVSRWSRRYVFAAVRPSTRA
jgi:hypothetical protein